MENSEQQPNTEQKITRVKSFLLAIGLAFLLLVLIAPPVFDLLNNRPIGVFDVATFAKSLLPGLVWIFGIIYCRRVAVRLGMRRNVALLTSFFLPGLAVIIYFYYSYKNKEKLQKIRTLKAMAGALASIVFLFVVVTYYVLGTPEYSLYKLREAIVNEDKFSSEKYLDIESIAKSFEELPSQSREWIYSQSRSILEIKEENPDNGKNADVYISTGLSGKFLKQAVVSHTDDEIGDSQIYLVFNDEGARILADITRRNIGKKIAIFLGGELISVPVVQSEITNGEAVIAEIETSQANFIVQAIEDEKISVVNGFEIRKRDVSKNFAKITIGKKNNSNGFEIDMIRGDSRRWKINKISTLIIDDVEANLPEPQGEKVATFNWKYKGKNYSLDNKLYDSYFEFYNSLPAENVFNGESLVRSLENNNALFIRKQDGDKTIEELVQSIVSLGKNNQLTDNQMVELVSVFVQTIPYDQEELENIDSGNHKVDYPYEVLYKNKGICSDKSYLAYSMLREMGYGVSFFLFPEDRHIAVGVECPLEYSNYESGYCFLETTSLGNKIGSAPSIMEKSRIASSKIELGDFGIDSSEDQAHPLGQIEVLNKTRGLVYTGIINTIAAQNEIDNLLGTIRKMDRELDASRNELDNQSEKIDDMEDKLKKMEKNLTSGNYDDYSSYYSKYEKAFSKFEKSRKTFNARITTRNQLNDKYNNLLESFYQ